MAKVALIKHSLPAMDAGTPAKQWQLCEEGRRRCNLLAEALAPHALQEIFSSDEPKARETAEIVAAHLRVPCQVVEELHEHDRSNVPLLPALEFQQAVRRLFQQPEQLMLGRETARQALERFSGALGGILYKRGQQDIAVVSHGTVISLYVADQYGCDGFGLWERLGLPSFLILSTADRRILQITEGWP